MAEPTPPEWLEILEARVPFFATYPPGERERFVGYLQAFIREKHFFGAAGLEVTDEMRVVVAAAAVRLVLHLGLHWYDRLTEIVLYPFEAYQHPNKDGAILGEAHTWGTVVLSWPAVLAGVSNPEDRHDTAVHEFAHVLDVADGTFDGTPELHARADFQVWGEVMSRHFLALRGRRGRRCCELLRAYGGTNEAEFFAVATEAFFEDPERLQEQAPDLYAELARFYRTPPAGVA